MTFTTLPPDGTFPGMTTLTTPTRVWKCVGIGAEVEAVLLEAAEAKENDDDVA